MKEERRRHKRCKLKLNAQIHDVDKGVESGLFEVAVIDVSKEGLKLSLKGLLEEGSRQLVSIPYRGIESLCFAEIVWKKFENQQMSYGLKIIRWLHLEKRLEANFNPRRHDNPFMNLFSQPILSFAH